MKISYIGTPHLIFNHSTCNRPIWLYSRIGIPIVVEAAPPALAFKQRFQPLLGFPFPMGHLVRMGLMGPGNLIDRLAAG